MNDELLIRFIERQCSVEEAREVLRWIEAAEQHKTHFKQLQSVCAAVEIDYASRTEKADPAEVRLIMSKISRKRFRLATYISAATCAAAAILLLLFIPFGKEQTNDYDYEKVLASITDQKEITLTVDKNKKIELADSSVTVAYNKKGEILINDTVTVTEKEEKNSSLNTIYVPYGKRSTLILADGTKVYLNSGSSLVYPAEFQSDKREVYLEGEACFEVTKEKERRFVVQTAYKEVEVLGTIFNVSIDKSQNKFETVLVAGKVALESSNGKIELTPNQYYGYASDTGVDEVKTVDARSYISWIDGKLKFKRESLSSILRKLEKSYNIELKMLDSKYLDYQISGSLDLKSTAEETMDVLMSILIPNYKSQNQKLYLIKSKK